MTEIFSSLYGQTEAQGPSGPSSMGFGPGKPLPPPVPQNPVHMAVPIPHQLVDEGPPLRKPAAMNEPFYLVRELPSEYLSDLIHLIMLTSFNYVQIPSSTIITTTILITPLVLVFTERNITLIPPYNHTDQGFLLPIHMSYTAL